jgi:NAD(P)-dependent dehydrogenase (short-subunit alcohol dehydrogenase family)
MTDLFLTNVVGPAHLAQTLLPLIEKSQKKFILNFSSGLASIGMNYPPKNASYSISKAAVGMLVCTRSIVEDEAFAKWGM